MYKKLFIIAIFSIFASCSNDSTDDLIDQSTVETARYSQDVKPIIDSNCLSCHGTVPSNGTPMSLTTYQHVKDAVTNRGLIERISLNEGQSGHMPLGGPRLPQQKIDLIMQWETQGFQE